MRALCQSAATTFIDSVYRSSGYRLTTLGTKSDPLLAILTDCPMSSFQICETLWQSHKVGKSATSKRLERLFKEGKIGRYLRIKNGAYIYYIPSLHSLELLIKASQSIVLESSGTLARVVQIMHTGHILSVFELGRISNIKFYKGGKVNPKIADLVDKMVKLGIECNGTNLLLPSLPPSETNSLVAHYQSSLDKEAYLLSFARKVFLSKKLAEGMTLYRQPSADSFANHKFDLFGHGGRRNRIRVVVECNLRREVTPSDLEGFCQRIGGTIKRSMIRKKSTDRSPVARYYIGGRFSEKAKSFAKQKNKGIRLLYADTVLRGNLEEISPYTAASMKPPYYGRFKEVRGLAFEAEIEPVYQRRGFKTKRRKKYFLLGNEVSDVDTGKTLTDVDLFAERGNGIQEILLIECKSSAENLTRKKLFEKTKKYQQIANYIQKNDPACRIRIVVIANVSRIDEEELLAKSKFEMEFISPTQFYNDNPKALKGSPKWMFCS